LSGSGRWRKLSSLLAAPAIQRPLCICWNWPSIEVIPNPPARFSLSSRLGEKDRLVQEEVTVQVSCGRGRRSVCWLSLRDQHFPSQSESPSRPFQQANNSTVTQIIEQVCVVLQQSVAGFWPSRRRDTWLLSDVASRQADTLGVDSVKRLPIVACDSRSGRVPGRETDDLPMVQAKHPRDPPNRTYELSRRLCGTQLHENEVRILA
jgi:hypothetical protein